ncbi:cyclopropane-fatty-acyl-phospholipid synthase [Lentinus tigrinus ALCF2SS1-7]|uniref:Cyclopropane-fatty-acyl-phospholipid synthase n=1 Tax=Lentinus tigrinus ALCF2SS1-6 TaxID=1328759 RepID=A0A5C2SFH7_9APHY|nr:cyclopropane-fatty-acyl-phospholipid synthase [Lentinus tigrinus ALCF2SS1-6]RPD77693.1 cyclopropane-fatty-acyl-phospholipid synthase [Lentinus tigrinus ALCF2SS1-7]
MSTVMGSLVTTSAAYIKSPLCSLAEKAATSLLQLISHGTLVIHTPARTYCFGESKDEDIRQDSDSSDALVAELTVRNPNFWLRLCAMGDLGFSEAYMYGEIDCEDLVKVFLVFLANRAQLSAIDNSLFSRLAGSLPDVGLTARIVNTVTNARKNISAHYDISNAMFMGFLSKDMTYSCAIFPELDGDLRQPSSSHHSSPHHSASNTPSLTGASTPSTLADSETHDPPKDLQLGALGLLSAAEGAIRKIRTLVSDVDDPLEAAQYRKLHHIIRKADIRPGHRVLEIGSGWGSMSLLITSTIPGTTVDTLTLSTQQAELARKRAVDAGLSDRIRVHLLDYRNMPAEWEGAFDRLVSVEMVEAVGREYMETYWAKIDWALNKETGVGVVQGITIPEARFEQYMREVDFIRKWVLFPGGFLPTLTFMVETLTKGSHGRLVVDSVSNIGPHYARTLREWRRRFEAHFEDTIIPALKAEYPGVMDTDDAKAQEEIEVFRRKWIYYYCYCEVGFTTRRLGDHIITFSREGNMKYGCEVYT